MTEPVHATPPDLPEPKTPLWLPGLGVALFLTAGLLWAATPAPLPIAQEDASDAGAEAASATRPPAPPPSASARPAVTPTMPSPSALAAGTPPLRAKLPADAGRPLQRAPLPKGAH